MRGHHGAGRVAGVRLRARRGAQLRGGPRLTAPGRGGVPRGERGGPGRSGAPRPRGVVAGAKRGFLGRAVRGLAERGVGQFLDIGSGIPTLGNVHEVAQEANPDARGMYVDIDPIAVQQSRSLLVGNPYARVVQGDLRKPDDILYPPDVLDLFDFSEPVAVLTVAVLHFVPDSADPSAILRRLGEPLVAGSHLVISHLGPESTAEGREAQE